MERVLGLQSGFRVIHDDVERESQHMWMKMKMKLCGIGLISLNPYSFRTAVV